MDYPENWHQLELSTAHLAIVLLLVVLFVLAVNLLAGKSLRHIEHFFSHALKAEFTERPGWLDLVILSLFCIFVYGPPIEQNVLQVLKLAHVNSDQRLVNPDLKFLGTVVVFLASLLYVGMYTPRSRRRK